MYNIERLIRGYKYLNDTLSYKEYMEYLIEKYKGILRPDGLYDFPGGVDISGQGLNIVPTIFGVVKGDFDCSNNYFSNLIGSPESVGKHFYCDNNQLQSLEGCPEYVGGHFWCYNNQLKSLVGSPISVGWSFWCYNNHLKNLEGCPSSVGEWFDCSNNHLKSLDGCPKSVGGNFSCRDNLVQFTEEEVRERCNVRGDVYV